MTREEPDRPLGRSDKRIPAALPIRVIQWDKDLSPRLETVCTYDISPHGARVTMLPGITGVGEILAVEQGGRRVCCRVVWTGGSGSQRRGQMGIQCVEPDVRLWEAELRYMQDLYDPMVPENIPARMNPADPRSRERRRHQRFQVGGLVELLRRGADIGSIEAELKDLSTFGCLVTPKDSMVPGTHLTLSLKVANYDLGLKGRVLHARANLGVGIQFLEIRKGDRQLLDHVLRELEGQDIPTNAMAEAAQISK
jgi:hypothetical protein